jgi:hypothetical protein
VSGVATGTPSEFELMFLSHVNVGITVQTIPAPSGDESEYVYNVY